jgi:hypothetical protein
MRTNELSETALDWAVAKCEGLLAFSYKNDMGLLLITLSTGETEYFKPTLDWAQGGPIIEREGICLVLNQHRTWDAHKDNVNFFETGTTPLIAAMRCYVASKLGDEVQIPEDVK